jgi:hypothetical protein
LPHTLHGRVVRYGSGFAEEVAKVYPELVIRGENGIDGVRYDELAPMLLNEVQQQQRINEAQAAEIRDLKQQQKQFAARAEQLNIMQQRMEEMNTALRWPAR